MVKFHSGCDADYPHVGTIIVVCPQPLCGVTFTPECSERCVFRAIHCELSDCIAQYRRSVGVFLAGCSLAFVMFDSPLDECVTHILWAVKDVVVVAAFSRSHAGVHNNGCNNICNNNHVNGYTRYISLVYIYQ